MIFGKRTQIQFAKIDINKPFEIRKWHKNKVDELNANSNGDNSNNRDNSNETGQVESV